MFPDCTCVVRSPTLPDFAATSRNDCVMHGVHWTRVPHIVASEPQTSTEKKRDPSDVTIVVALLHNPCLSSECDEHIASKRPLSLDSSKARACWEQQHLPYCTHSPFAMPSLGALDIGQRVVTGGLILATGYLMSVNTLAIVDLSQWALVRCCRIRCPYLNTAMLFSHDPDSISVSQGESEKYQAAQAGKKSD